MKLEPADLAPLPEVARRAYIGASASLQAGDARAALAQVLALVQRHPDFASGWHLAGLVALQVGDLRLAIEALEKGVRIAPAEQELVSNLSAAYLRVGRHLDAERTAEAAHQLAPHKAAPLLNRSTALQALGRLDEAVRGAEQALALEPERPQAWNNLGNLYKEQGRLADALSAYQKALELDPNLREAFSNRLAALKLDPEQTPASLLEAHRAFAARYECPVLAEHRLLDHDAQPDRRLRIGYVSPDCHGAVPAFLQPIWRSHDPAGFEIYCYFNNPQAPETTAALADKIQQRVMRGMSDAAVADQVRADRIDILVDIAGHTGKNRLGVFMLRPAPIQMTWLDYLGTTGLDSMDYRITDLQADPPPIAQAAHSEMLLHLPQPQWCWDAPVAAPPVAPMPATRSAQFTFGSCNNYSKLTDATLALWRGLFASVPESRLLVVGAPEGEAQRRVRRALALPPERLAFSPRVGATAYRNLFAQIDLMLDPVPFSGATTTLDALWQGVPVLTLPGATSASRSSASLLRALGLDDFVALDADDYRAIAARCVAGRENLAVLRAGMRQRLASSPIMDAKRFTAALETLYRRAWMAWATAKSSLATDAPAALEVRTTPWRGQELAFAKAVDLLHAGQLDEGIGLLGEVLVERQNWALAQRYYASAVLAWARHHPECARSFTDRLPQPPGAPKVSIIVCSIDADKLASVRMSYAERFAGLPHEFIAITNAKSLAEGYNRGAAKADGEILVFSHDDIALLTPDFAPRLLSHLAQFDGVGVCGTRRASGATWDRAGRPYLAGHILHHQPGETGFLLFVAGCCPAVMREVEGLDGVFIAVRRQVWEALRFDEEAFDGFHLYDLDFSLRAARQGFSLAVPQDLMLSHQSIGRFDHAWGEYARRFEAKHAANLAPPLGRCAGNMHVRMTSIDEARLLLAGLRHFEFGKF
jgi:predicted O-linked N-acetylglucosamine transferase (SPINDLY family)